MSILPGLKKEIASRPDGRFCPDLFRCRGYEGSRAKSNSGIRADGVAAIFETSEPHIYRNDLIAGSILDVFATPGEDELALIDGMMLKYPERGFGENGDHFAADYFTAVKKGIPGLLSDIDESIARHGGEPEKTDYLESMKKTLTALSHRLTRYAEKARSLIGAEGYDDGNLSFIAGNCEAVANGVPKTFAEGLQLVWMIHSCFVCEGRYAMALGRIDMYLYPLFVSDKMNGTLSDDEAEELLANAFAKICEHTHAGCDDVVNICIGGVDENGKDSTNALSYCVLRAVRDVNLPGPNLSARITPDCPDGFLDECLKVIGTGLGYPALMNDPVQIAALSRKGYDIKDVRNYCMVGCIENFITGKQPPWVDGRFDPIKYLEDILLESDAEALDSVACMDDFVGLLEEKFRTGADEYYEDQIRKVSYVPDPENMTSPFMSCFCDCCIERGLDINMGGARYPSAHGAVLMGIGTLSDSLAAIEFLVFDKKQIRLSELAEALRNDFDGYENLREQLISAPKYGNNDDFADKYAVWYTRCLSDIFDGYRTLDGGAVYTAMAANTANISAGEAVGATPDGRLAGRPLSDAASPTYGRDVRGVTSTLLSVSKPDYTRCACGTVVNQKFSPSAFRDGKREKLAQLIRVYFARGGQEIQINSTSRETLIDAMDHPEKYPSLVVRVSGYSALYVTLAREVQEDILSRTQHEDL